jgi:hypothetical protein
MYWRPHTEASAFLAGFSEVEARMALATAGAKGPSLENPGDPIPALVLA